MNREMSSTIALLTRHTTVLFSSLWLAAVYKLVSLYLENNLDLLAQLSLRKKENSRTLLRFITCCQKTRSVQVLLALPSGEGWNLSSVFHSVCLCVPTNLSLTVSLSSNGCGTAWGWLAEFSACILFSKTHVKRKWQLADLCLCPFSNVPA